MLTLRLPSRESGSFHPLGVIRERIENDVSFIPLKSVRVYYNEIMPSSQIVIDLLSDHVVDKPHLFLKETNDSERRFRVSRIAKFLLEGRNQFPGFYFILLGAGIDAPFGDVA